MLGSGCDLRQAYVSVQQRPAVVLKSGSNAAFPVLIRCIRYKKCEIT